MAHLLISAAHKSSGKTTISLGLCAALRKRGQTVQPFKKGPDYIDPLWLSLASQRPCRNLDFYLMDRPEIDSLFRTHASAADISIIEANKGLYDGLDLDGSNSNAALAALLQAPVVLVIDARGMTRGIAPLILGYQAFDRDINIAGVILNKLGGSRHEAKLRAVIEHYTDVPVLGAVHYDERLTIVERHLGLMPSNEATEADRHIDEISDIVADQVDLEKIQAVAAQAPAVTPPAPATDIATPSPDVRIGIARDAAFAFYYPDDLEALRAAGAELVFFDTLRDQQLPTMDGLIIGGGFPEVQMHALSANEALRSELRAAIDAGLPTYAECGGLMYLARSIQWDGQRREMVGVLPADVVMHERPQGRGYVRLRESDRHPWPSGTQADVRVHEFHYSSLENADALHPFAFNVLRGTGIDGQHDGFVHRNLLACYSHQRNVGDNDWCARFVEFVRKHVRSRARGLHAAP